MGEDGPPLPITLHSTWRGIVGTLLGATILLSLGSFAVAYAGWRFLPTALFVAGCLAVIVVLFDYPVATTFTSDGVQRRMVFRRQLIPWDHVTKIVRARPGFSFGVRKFTHGGFTAVVGRRRYLLVDQGEGYQEFARLESLIEDLGADVEFDAVQPPRDEATPTWTYRRRKWIPDDAADQ